MLETRALVYCLHAYVPLMLSLLLCVWPIMSDTVDDTALHIARERR